MLKKKSALKNFLLLFLSSFIYLSNAFAYSRDIAESIGSVNGAGLGGTIGYFPQDAGLFNSADLSNVQRMGVTSGVFLSPQFDGMYAAVNLPSSFGTIVLNPMYVQDAKNDSYFSFRVGYGRALTEHLSFGLFALPSYGKNTAGSFFGLGIEPALTYNTLSSISFGNHLGLYNFSFFILARNLSINMGKAENAPRSSLRLGFRTDWYKNKNYTSYLLLETLGIGGFTTMPVHWGMGFSWSFLHINAGYMFSKESHLFRGFSLGGGLNFNFENGNLRANYAFLPPNDVRSEGYHFISIGGLWGSVDNEAPKVSIKVQPQYFSPNHDGKNDYAFFNISVQDKSAIANWRLSIKNSLGQIVREFQHDDREIQRGFGISDFFKTAFNRRESLVVPPVIRWDGTANRLAIEESGLGAQSSLPDGIYTYSLVVGDIHGNISKPWNGTVVIDTVKPYAKLNLENEMFSPNNDGNLDTLVVLQETFGAPEDNWEGKIRNLNGDVIANFLWESAPPSFVWDGTQKDGTPAPEGLYIYELIGRDKAQNTSSVKTKPFTLSRRVDKIDLRLSAQGFSPNKDGRFDTINLIPQLENRIGLESWEILITDKQPKADSPRSNLVMEYSGVSADTLPNSITWDGKGMGGALQKDGTYYATLRVRYSNGNKPTTFPKPFTIDLSPPSIGVEADLRIFTPDGDGNAEEQIFRLDMEDPSGISDWRLDVYEIQYNEKNIRTRLPFKAFSGKEEWPAKIFWDGKSDSGRLVESATVYDYILTAADRYGNKAETPVARFESGILVLQTKRGLQIRLSSIEFDLGKSSLKKNAIPVLEKLSIVLHRYPNYEIKIEGHTDDIGDDSINLRLSEQRALTVMNYLIEKENIPKERLTYEGRGEVFPLLPNNSWYNRSRNRRVEFILLK